MDRGAFAMFDALGTKGIWKTHDPDVVVAKFQRLQTRFQQFLEQQLGGEGYPHIRSSENNLKDVRFGFLSDTVVLAIVPKAGRTESDRDRCDEFCVILAARFAGAVMRLAAADEPRWAYRGCITFGDFASADNKNDFFVGPAVDDAAAMMNEAQGAFVWLTPSASRMFPKGVRAGIEPGPLLRYPVPMKQLGSFTTYVASPFDVGTTTEDSEAIASHILGTFAAPGLDVAIKRENTDRFFRHHLASRQKKLDENNRFLDWAKDR